MLLFKIPQVKSPSKYSKRSGHKVFPYLSGGLLGLIATFGVGEISQAQLEIKSNKQASQSSICLEKNTGLNKRYLITPKRRALLNTIRYAEGTWKGGRNLGYKTIYGGGTFEDISRHPKLVVVKRYTSAAAGAYQFIPSTWMEVANQMDLHNFEPESQDQAALHLICKTGVLEAIDNFGLTHFATSALSKEWASFPNHIGKSRYGQPAKRHKELSKFFQNNLTKLKRTAKQAPE